jgi:galactonate dehydratase
MKITKIEDFQADGGWQTWSFLKISTDEGVFGWSEFSGMRTGGFAALIHALGQALIGKDPRQIGRIEASLEAATRIAAGGPYARATSAIINACLDIKAKALGVPVYDLFGGAIRDKVPLYWSHCGLYRSSHPDFFEKQMNTPGVRTIADLEGVAKEAADKGYKALKTNLLMFDGPGGTVGASLMRRGVDPARTLSKAHLHAVRRQMEIFADAAGLDMGLMIDLNFSYKADGFKRVARELEDLDMAWLEIDLFEPAALAEVRRSTSTPIASLEAVYGRGDLLPYLQNQAVDVAIIDMMWNGLPEALRMSTLCDTYQVNVAAHTAGSPFHAVMGAHYGAACVNFHVLEFDADIVPWATDVLGELPAIADGYMTVPTAPGWGMTINEEALRAHPVG